jgi:microcystin-dependent protein
MSIVLDRILAQSATMFPSTVYLSPESMTVLLFALSFIENKRAWLDKNEEPLDEVTDEEWDEIETMVGNLAYEVMTPMIGQLVYLLTDEIPENMLLCDGSVYDREDYPALYDAIWTPFRISETQFFVPQLGGLTLVGTGTSFISGTNYDRGQFGGEETHELTADENGEHTHTELGHTHLYNPPGITIAVVAPGEVPALAPNLLPANTGSTAVSLDNSGLGQAHNNMQPWTASWIAVIAK